MIKCCLIRSNWSHHQQGIICADCGAEVTAAKYPRSFSIETSEGMGEAYRDARGSPWVVLMPNASFTTKGSLSSVQGSIRRALKTREVSFGPLRYS